MTYKKIIIAILFFIFTLSVQGETTCLIVERLNGMIEEVELSESVNIKFDSGNFYISLDRETGSKTLSIPLSDLKEYRFISKQSNVIPITSDSSFPEYVKIKIEHHSLSITTNDKSVDLRIIDLDGIVFTNSHIDSNTTFSVDMASWKSGVYVLLLNGISHKIVKL